MAPVPREHILNSFETALRTLHDNLLLMASLTERNLGNTFSALFERDNELANQAIADDEEVDTLEKQVDHDGMDLLLRFQPVARDLRGIIAAMKIGANLERIADQATSIARRVRKLNDEPALPETHQLEVMTREATAMFKDSLQAFTDGDVDLALSIKPRDRQLDEMNRNIAARMTERMAADAGQIRGYLDLIFIARNLERIGDHATNIAEDAIYTAQARDIRHSGTQPLSPTTP